MSARCPTWLVWKDSQELCEYATPCRHAIIEVEPRIPWTGVMAEAAGSLAKRLLCCRERPNMLQATYFM